MDQELKEEFKKLNERLDRSDRQLTGFSTTVGDLSTKFDGLSTTVGDLSNEVEGLSTVVGGLTPKVESLIGRVDSISTFIQQNMPLKADLQELEERIASKNDIDLLLRAVDAYAKQSKDYSQEVAVLGAQTNRVEKWAKEVAAPKLGVKYET